MPITAEQARLITQGRHVDPFSCLGMHVIDGVVSVTVHNPGTDTVDVLHGKSGKKLVTLDKMDETRHLFYGVIPKRKTSINYKLRLHKGDASRVIIDPYGFPAVIGELDQHLLSQGSHRRLWEMLGAHEMKLEGVEGTHFAVWAPNAQIVALVGDFNGWNPTTHVMRHRGNCGVWEIFIPGVAQGEHYKFELRDSHGNSLPQKADPFGFGAEHPPKTASIVRKLDDYEWSDDKWMEHRQHLQQIDAPISIYEVNLSSWKRVPEEGGRPLSYLEHASQLVKYVKDMGFTHMELMPISEFPFDGSWGYQPVGLYAPTIRYGTLEEFRRFVEACHNAGIGLILDWVPGHFPEDEHGIGQFDGTALYEHADRKEGFHPDWNTLLFNYGRREVANYLVANAVYWTKEHHIDGLRVDAVASMLYRDYSRNEGEWVPNKFGGRENLEAIDFLQNMNGVVYCETPGIMTIAEESTAFPGVSAPTSHGGLGFGYKWNMGWMNDTLAYMQQDPIHRKYHHHKMTFGLHYAFSENFVLPLSHDEVVHGKGSLINKMPGNDAEKIANLRAYYGFMWGHPGKKLLFMGGEFGQLREWNHDSSLDWHLLNDPAHAGLQNLVRDLNNLYRSTPALHQLDCKPEGFQWIEGGAADESVFIWVRQGNNGAAPVLVVSNFTPVERSNRYIGVPHSGKWIEKLNTDSSHYGGKNRGNLGGVESNSTPASGLANSIRITIPPLSTVFFELD